MAEGPDPVSETVLELEQEVTCGICHDQYQEPKLLPCCHYYCKQCILKLSSHYQPNQPFPCPDCHEPTLLPGNNPNGLPAVFFINRMKELHSRMEKAHSMLETICEICSRGKVVAFCHQCAHFICEECVKSHELMKKVFAGHVISTLEELKQGGVKELLVEETPPPICDIHEEPKKIFCFDCNQLVCRDCIVVDHAGHKFEFVKKAAPESRKKLAEHLSPLKKLIPNLSTAVDQVKSTKEEIKAEKKLIERQVNASFQELHAILDRCKARLLRESSDLANKKVEKLTIQEKGLDLSLGTVQSLIDFVERTLENASDEEIITMQDQVLSRIDAEVVKRENEAANADPVEEVDFSVDVLVSEGLKKLCETKARVCEGVIGPLKCTVEGDGAKSAEVGKSTKLRVIAKLINGRRSRKPHKVQAVLKSLVENTVTKLKAVRTEQGVFNIEYTPTVRGQHHLMISVDSQPIAGSPFSVFVKIPLDKAVRVIRGIKNPRRYLTFNSSEELIVTERDGNVVILDKKGERLRSISKSKHGLGSSAGVAVDKDDHDNIYISDWDKDCVYKFNKNGDMLKKFGKNSSGPKDLKYPRGIAVVNDQVLVCDQNNHRVQVLTTELEHVKQIGSSGTGDGQFNYPEDIAADEQQMLYITDSSNSRVQILTRDGQFVRSFGKKGSGQENLSIPTGVCVDQFGNIYVAEYDECVSVFHKDGQFVTSFGKGHVSCNYGVAVDRDGFVYVCNTNNVAVF